MKKGEKTRIIKKIKRGILIFSIFLFAGFAVSTFFSTQNTMQNSRASRIFVWSTSTVANPLIKSLPTWLKVGIGIVALYLWYQHKLIMSIIYGMLIGVYFAL